MRPILLGRLTQFAGGLLSMVSTAPGAPVGKGVWPFAQALSSGNGREHHERIERAAGHLVELEAGAPDLVPLEHGEEYDALVAGGHRGVQLDAYDRSAVELIRPTLRQIAQSRAGSIGRLWKDHVPLHDIVIPSVFDDLGAVTHREQAIENGILATSLIGSAGVVRQWRFAGSQYDQEHKRGRSFGRHGPSGRSLGRLSHGIPHLPSTRSTA